MNININISHSPTVLEIPEDLIDRLWQESEGFSNSNSRWQGYLNKIVLATVLPWLEEESNLEITVPYDERALSSFWEIVNGTPINIGNYRAVLIPQEEIDTLELRVAQEWVDISEWAADYYLGIQVDLEEGIVSVWGYTTHECLKNKSSYSPRDRAYSLEEKYVTQDLNLLWLFHQFCSQENNRTNLDHIEDISLETANNLLERLGDPKIILPRLIIPFTLWASLLKSDDCRINLYQKRLGLPKQFSILEWLERGISDFAGQFGWEILNLQLEGGRGMTTKENPLRLRTISRRLTVAGQNYALSIAPQGEIKAGVWQFKLENITPGGSIPAGFKLRLLTERLEEFDDNEDVADRLREDLLVEIELEPGEGLIWEIEPIPDNYNREILRF
jgi:hypothetical protein